MTDSPYLDPMGVARYLGFPDSRTKNVYDLARRSVDPIPHFTILRRPWTWRSKPEWLDEWADRNGRHERLLAPIDVLRWLLPTETALASEIARVGREAGWESCGALGAPPRLEGVSERVHEGLIAHLHDVGELCKLEGAQDLLETVGEMESKARTRLLGVYRR